MKNKMNQEKFYQGYSVTTDYSIFKKLQGHRAINEKHLENLKTLTMTMLTYDINIVTNARFVVNEKMELVDGQHMLEVAKEFKFPVWYRVWSGSGLKEAKNLNTVRWPRKYEVVLNKF